jgi:hypothetical protein
MFKIEKEALTSRAEELAARLVNFAQQKALADRTFGIAITKKCSVGCRHCINDSRKNRRSVLSQLTIEKVIREAVESGQFDVINITGGEPFEVFEHTLFAVETCRRFGTIATIVTSANWASDRCETVSRLGLLVEAGLRVLIVSRDEFHEPTVPAAYVANALAVADALGIKTALNLTVGYGTKDAQSLLAPISSLLSSEITQRVQITTNSIIRSGRAAKLFKLSWRRDELPRDEPRPFICIVNGPVINDDESFTACCGPELPANSPLRHGCASTNTVGEVFEGITHDPIIQMIRTIGLQRMASLAYESGMLSTSELEFIRTSGEEAICEICLLLLSKQERVEQLRSLALRPEIRREIQLGSLVLYGETDLNICQ